MNVPAIVNRQIYLFSSLLLILLISVSATCSGGQTIRVCSFGCQFSKIQPAIEAANPGDTVLIKLPPILDLPVVSNFFSPQIYKANLEINKPLTLKSSDKLLIKPKNNRKTVISIGPSSGVVMLEGLNLEGAGRKRCTRVGMPSCPDGILVHGRQRYIFHNLKFPITVVLG